MHIIKKGVYREMKFEVKNELIAPAINILQKIKLKGLKSIHRSRLKDLLMTHLDRVGKEEKELKEQYAKKDENGEPILNETEDGQKFYDIENREDLGKALDEFFNEKVVIDGGDSQVFLKSVKASLETSDVEWSGQESDYFVQVYDGFIEDKNENESDDV